jgi:hypothetical protein
MTKRLLPRLVVPFDLGAATELLVQLVEVKVVLHGLLQLGLLVEVDFALRNGVDEALDGGPDHLEHGWRVDQKHLAERLGVVGLEGLDKVARALDSWLDLFCFLQVRATCE